ncbi:MAG: glucosidase [Parachlamydiales bacterium]
MTENRELERLEAHRTRKANWKKWGPYLSERGWGTVREDYSPNGEAWTFFPHDHARSKVYRWNEDGLAGICDRNQYLCMAFSLWNGKDPILKERMFGLNNQQGNHGEDVKEYWFYLDSTPTHSYMKMLYKYPQAEYPYKNLVEENGRRGYLDPEYELLDTGVFNEDRYYDCYFEYAKGGQSDILCKVTVCNRGPEEAHLHLLPNVWFRNTWVWGYDSGPMGDVPVRPSMKVGEGPQGVSTLECEHSALGKMYFYANGAPDLLFTENETNNQLLFDLPNRHPYVKDAFHRYLVKEERGAVNPKKVGTKAAAHYKLRVPAHGEQTVWLRLSKEAHSDPFGDFEKVFKERKEEADVFYQTLHNPDLSDEERRVQRQAFAGLLWSKELYYYDVEQWLHGDNPAIPQEKSRLFGRNHNWQHLVNFDVISMPDKWEYPWYATWDLAFHCIALVLVDPDFAKRQLLLLTREWYMHPNGALAAYEWNFDDANPPVHAWAAWRVFKIDAKMTGTRDIEFLEGIFHKLLLNFTWWVNRKDSEGNNVFQGGFLGLDNISIFDRSHAIPKGGRVDQSDGTSWMGFYSLTMMKIALELSVEDPIYQDSATKFFEHFLRIAHAMTNLGGRGHSLWDKEDGFFYDALHTPDGATHPLKVRSLVGLMPLLAVETLEPEVLERFPVFARRIHWFVNQRPHLAGNMTCLEAPGKGERRIMSILTKERLLSVLKYLLNEEEFLSPHGIRSVSKYHEAHPYTLHIDGSDYTIDYQPAESKSGLFGGNSNWRGPVWFPITYLLIESLQKFQHYYGDDFKVEFPTGSGEHLNLKEIARRLSQRMCSLFMPDDQGRRPVHGKREKFQTDPHWKDLLLFHEYFHGDTGEGLGASHQTGWTGLVVKLLQQSGGIDYSTLSNIPVSAHEG